MRLQRSKGSVTSPPFRFMPCAHGPASRILVLRRDPRPNAVHGPFLRPRAPGFVDLACPVSLRPGRDRPIRGRGHGGGGPRRARASRGSRARIEIPRPRKPTCRPSRPARHSATVAGVVVCRPPGPGKESALPSVCRRATALGAAGHPACVGRRRPGALSRLSRARRCLARRRGRALLKALAPRSPVVATLGGPGRYRSPREPPGEPRCARLVAEAGDPPTRRLLAVGHWRSANSQRSVQGAGAGAWTRFLGAGVFRGGRVATMA